MARTLASQSSKDRGASHEQERSPNLPQSSRSEAHTPLLKLHHLVGNRVLSQWLQPNPEPSPLTGGVLQHKCATCEQTLPSEAPCPDCEHQQKIQRRATNPVTRAAIPAAVQKVVRSPGQPLDLTTRRLMETHFSQNLRANDGLEPVPLIAPKTNLSQPGDASEQQADHVADSVLQEPSSHSSPTGSTYDFSQVRIHTDRHAADSARAVNALAYTVGSNIVFGAGQYAPGTGRGQHLLAHELTHVLQQRQHASTASGAVQRQTGSGTAPPTTGLSDEMLKQIARQLREAMAGLGTDEEAIYSALSGRTQDQVEAIARTYQEMYKRDLTADLQDELNDSELQQLGAFSPIAAIPPGSTVPSAKALADRVAAQLNEAMQGLGTDEESIYAALTGRTEAERQEIKLAYRRLTNRELEADLRDEMSGSELTQALKLLNQGMLQPEDELYLAMAGLGTDEDAIFRVLSELAGNVVRLQSLQANYDDKYGDLIQDLRSDLSDEEYTRVRKYLQPTIPDADVQDCDSAANPLQQPNTVRDAHARAFQMLTTAISKSANTSDPNVQAVAATHFRITLPPTTPEDMKLWIHIKRALETMRRADTEATYECEPIQNFWNGACISGNIAISLSNIHLCPLWWTEYPTVDERAGVLLHEWGHKFGTGVNRIFEAYCYSPEFATLPASELVHLPDAYMGYAYELETGTKMPCK